MYFGSVGTVKPNTNGEMHLKKITFHTLVTPRVTPACPPRCSGRHLSNSADLVNLVVAPPFPPSPQPPIHTSRLRHHWRLRRSRRPRARDLHKALGISVCGGCAASKNVVARGVYRQETWYSCRCSRLVILNLDDEPAGASSKACRRKSSDGPFCALGSTYVLDSTYGLDSSYGGHRSRAYVWAQFAAADL